MTDENTGGAVEIYTGPDTGTALATTDGAPGTEGEGAGWQEPTAPEGVLDYANNPAHVAYAVDAMSYWDRDENGVLVDNTAEQLKEDWGGDMAANLAFSEAFGRAHPDILSVIYEAGMGDHPVVLRIAAMLGRRYAEISGDATTINSQRGTNMTEGDRGGFEDQIEEIQERIDKAQAQGDSYKANRLYKEQQGLYAKIYGTGPVVGTSGGPNV